MSEITTYEKTKDSGIEWIEEIPKDWGINIINQIFSNLKGQGKKQQSSGKESVVFELRQNQT